MTNLWELRARANSDWEKFNWENWIIGKTKGHEIFLLGPSNSSWGLQATQEEVAVAPHLKLQFFSEESGS